MTVQELEAPEREQAPLAAELAVPLLPRVDLLPPEIGERRRLRRVQAGLGGAVLATLLLIAVLHAAATGSVRDAQSELTAATAVTTGLQAEQRQYDDVVATARQAEAATAVLSAAMGSEIRFSGLLATLSRSTPEGVWLRSVTLTQAPPAPAAAPAPGTDPAAAPAAPAVVGVPQVPDAVGTLTVVARGVDHEVVAAWLESLADAPGVTAPTFSSSTEQRVGTRTLVEFTSTATLTSEALSGRYTDGAPR